MSNNTMPNTADLSPTKAAEAALRAKYDAGGNPLADLDQKPIIAPAYARKLAGQCYSTLADWLDESAPAHIRALLCAFDGLSCYAHDHEKAGFVSADANASILDGIADAANALAAAGAL
jgi:hypothetical protein